MLDLLTGDSDWVGLGWGSCILWPYTPSCHTESDQTNLNATVTLFIIKSIFQSVNSWYYYTGRSSEVVGSHLIGTAANF